MTRAIISSFVGTKVLEQHGDDILNILLNLVAEGNLDALKIAVNRLIPAPEHKVKLIVGDLNTPDDILRATQKIIYAVTQGEVPVNIGNKLVGIMKDYVSIKRELEIEPRLAALEALLNEKL